MIYVWVALGGAVGALLRFVISNQVMAVLGKDFPFGTLTVNVIGSFLLGIALAYAQQLPDNSDTFIKGFVMVGVLGALTTFSTFSLDTVALLQLEQYGKAILNIVLNLVCCFSMTWLALHIMKG
jgi:CrcB protein